MGSRLQLHDLLLTIADNVYFQPPESLKMKYPAIRYKLSDIDNGFANDNVYMQSHVYDVTVIDEDPDSEISEKISKLPTAIFDRPYIADGLNHYVYTIHY